MYFNICRAADGFAIHRPPKIGTDFVGCHPDGCLWNGSDWSAKTLEAKIYKSRREVGSAIVSIFKAKRVKYIMENNVKTKLLTEWYKNDH